MFFDISSSNFKHIFEQEDFHLPKRWDGKDFYATIKSLYRFYLQELRRVAPKKSIYGHYNDIDDLCHGILCSIDYYFNGYPSLAYERFSSVMNTLMQHPIKTYRKTGWDDFFTHNGDPFKLFRVRNVGENILYTRTDIFHTPYNLRSKVATCRYSIAGYPSLYLGTSLELCCQESKTSSVNEFQIASRFQLDRNQNNHNMQIQVIELAVKPQDFGSVETDNIDTQRVDKKRFFDEIDLGSDGVRSAYISWYPLIAACSYIRTSKSDPFAAEYIIPQLLMQWIRNKYDNDKLYGVRYFSCASEIASDMGFNYVFPVSGQKYDNNLQFCRVLTKTFRLTIPKYIHEYKSLGDCTKSLINDNELDYIFSYDSQMRIDT